MVAIHKERLFWGIYIDMLRWYGSYTHRAVNLGF